MAYFRQRRTQPPYQPAFDRQGPDGYPVDEDGDRIYTEEDYAVREEAPLPEEDAFQPEDEAFLPDDEMYLPADEDVDPAETGFDPFNIPHTVSALRMNPAYSSLEEIDDLDDDPLAEDLLTEEELVALRRSHWKLLSGMADFMGVIVGTAVILLLVMLLVSLINWLMADVNQTFTLWQTRI